MFLTRVIQHGIILSFLAVTASALVFTLTRIRVPGVPWALVYRSYRMMAPYQGDEFWNGDLLAEGRLQDGAWERIDLSSAFPYGFGERNVRMFLRGYAPLGPGVLFGKYRELGEQLLHRERMQGHRYAELRLTFERWPRSPGGFEFLRHEPFFEKRILLAIVR